MTTEEKLAAARLKLEHMFKQVRVGNQGPFTENGTKYTEIKSGLSKDDGVAIWLPSDDEAIDSWLMNAGAFAYEHWYELPFKKTLVWRREPEIAQREDGTWAVYSRFAVEVPPS